MTTIGTFTHTQDGSYTGEIATLTVRHKAALIPSKLTGKKSPDFLVVAGTAEIGIAWKKTSRAGDTYFAVRLDDPTFPAPIWANLVESHNEAGIYYKLLWDRPKPTKAE